MTIPPHIPLEPHHSREHNSHHVRAPHIMVIVVIAALTGFIASLLYSAYGPTTTYHTSTETRVERVTDVLDETIVKTTQESIATFTGERADLIVAYGTAVTGDGWFLVPAAGVKAKHVVIHPQTLGAIESVVADPATGFVFAKTTVKNARLLQYGNLDSLGRGTKLTIVLPRTAIPVTLQDPSVCMTDHCPSEYGDKLSYAAGIVEALPQFVVDGAPVITAQGSLVGIALRVTGGRVVIVPMTQFRTVFSSVFSKGIATRSKITLPVRALNLTRWSFIDVTGRMPEQGMLIESAGATLLKEGDVITTIERQPIEANSTLFDMVSRLQDVERISMTILRKGATMDLVIPLK